MAFQGGSTKQLLSWKGPANLLTSSTWRWGQAAASLAGYVSFLLTPCYLSALLKSIPRAREFLISFVPCTTSSTAPTHLIHHAPRPCLFVISLECFDVWFPKTKGMRTVVSDVNWIVGSECLVLRIERVLLVEAWLPSL